MWGGAGEWEGEKGVWGEGEREVWGGGGTFWEGQREVCDKTLLETLIYLSSNNCHSTD